MNTVVRQRPDDIQHLRANIPAAVDRIASRLQPTVPAAFLSHTRVLGQRPGIDKLWIADESIEVWQDMWMGDKSVEEPRLVDSREPVQLGHAVGALKVAAARGLRRPDCSAVKTHFAIHSSG